MPELTKKLEKSGPKEYPAKHRGDSYTASEVRSGFLVTAAFLTLVVLLFMAGHFQLFQETYKVRILFNYISGLVKNAPVHFAGHEVGKVTEIRLLGKDEGEVKGPRFARPLARGLEPRASTAAEGPRASPGPQPTVDVTVSLSKEAVLKKDSQAFIDLLGFMGEKFVELTPGSQGAPVLKENETILGTDPIGLNAIMKKGTDIADELQKTTVSLRSLIHNLNDTMGASQTDIRGILKNLNASSSNLKEMTQDLKKHPWKLLRKGQEEKTDERKKRLFFF